MDYWRECIAEALHDAGLSATDKQIDIIAEWAEGAHENYGMYTGQDVASANLKGAQDREREELKQRLEYEQTVPRNRCPTCKGHGILVDGWGREFGCNDCGGKGSKPAYPFRFSMTA